MQRTDPRVEAAAAALLGAARGSKAIIIDELATDLGCSRQTAYRRVHAVVASLRPDRKRRCDAGTCAVSREEALKISSMLEETRKKTGTGATSVRKVLENARQNGAVSAGQVDEATGEWKPVSVATVRRAMRKHKASAAQLARPAPASRLSSPHPNHCWQIDASVSRQFYLAESGAEEMPKAQFYRGKPKNFDRIADRRLWRYVVTDHASGCIEVFYVRGAESSANMIATLIHVMTNRAIGTMHGVPKYLMADPGSAVTAGSTRNFVDALGIKYIVNAVGAARVKGQVENAHYIVECDFEASLKYQAPACSLEEINTLAQEWARAYNATQVHSRTRLTRREGWLRIASDQLVLAPSVDVLQRVASSSPKRCLVRDYFIKFKGRQFDVRAMPGGIGNLEYVEVITNALDPSTVRILLPDDESGRSVHFLAPVVTYDERGFVSDAGVIGESFRQVPETATDAARREIERLAMDVQTDEEAVAARKAKRLPFGGRINPMQNAREVVIPPALPRAGTPSTVLGPIDVHPKEEVLHQWERPIPTISTSAALMTLRKILNNHGHAWNPAYIARLDKRFAGQIPEDDLFAVAMWLRTTDSNVASIGGEK